MKLFLASSLLIGIVLTISNPAIDLRPEDLKEAGIKSWQAETGRAMLQEMANSHGLEKYSTYKYQEIRFRNDWEFLPGSVFRPWPENGQLLKMRCKVGDGEFTSEVRFESGSNKGEAWGLENRHGYKRASQFQLPEFGKDPTSELWLSTFQFLFEAPFRLKQAEIVAYVGDKTLDGKTYHKVFLTWGQESASMKTDQMIAWINAENMQLEKLHYTCRDSGFGFFSATIHYEDFHRVEGILESHRQYITFGGPKLKENGNRIPLHEVQWEGNSSFRQ